MSKREAWKALRDWRKRKRGGKSIYKKEVLKSMRKEKKKIPRGTGKRNSTDKKYK